MLEQALGCAPFLGVSLRMKLDEPICYRLDGAEVACLDLSSSLRRGVNTPLSGPERYTRALTRFFQTEEGVSP